VKKEAEGVETGPEAEDGDSDHFSDIGLSCNRRLGREDNDTGKDVRTRALSHDGRDREIFPEHSNGIHLYSHIRK
jgi:hypothetical protein